MWVTIFPILQCLHFNKELTMMHWWYQWKHKCRGWVSLGCHCCTHLTASLFNDTEPRFHNGNVFQTSLIAARWCDTHPLSPPCLPRRGSVMNFAQPDTSCGGCNTAARAVSASAWQRSWSSWSQEAALTSWRKRMRNVWKQFRIFTDLIAFFSPHETSIPC